MNHCFTVRPRHTKVCTAKGQHSELQSPPATQTIKHHKSFQVIQNHTSHQHIITCINTPGLLLSHSTGGIFNCTHCQKLRHRTTQRYTTKTYTKRSLTLSTWGFGHGCYVRLLGCLVYLYTCKKQIKEQHCFPDLACIFCILPYKARLSNELDLSYKAIHECEG